MTRYVACRIGCFAKGENLFLWNVQTWFLKDGASCGLLNLPRHAPLNHLDESNLKDYFQIVSFVWQTRFCRFLCVEMEGVAVLSVVLFCVFEGVLWGLQWRIVLEFETVLAALCG